jgi:hypothetical protein
MILVELANVAIRCVTQETLPGATFKRKNRRHYFRTNGHICTKPLLQYKVNVMNGELSIKEKIQVPLGSTVGRVYCTCT